MALLPRFASALSWGGGSAAPAPAAAAAPGREAPAPVPRSYVVFTVGAQEVLVLVGLVGAVVGGFKIHSWNQRRLRLKEEKRKAREKQWAAWVSSLGSATYTPANHQLERLQPVKPCHGVFAHSAMLAYFAFAFCSQKKQATDAACYTAVLAGVGAASYAYFKLQQVYNDSQGAATAATAAPVLAPPTSSATVTTFPVTHDSSTTPATLTAASRT